MYRVILLRSVGTVLFETSVVTVVRTYVLYTGSVKGESGEEACLSSISEDRVRVYEIARQTSRSHDQLRTRELYKGRTLRVLRTCGEPAIRGSGSPKKNEEKYF